MARSELRHPGFMRERQGNDAGQALIEFALTMPLMILLLVGALELARIAFAAIEVSNAARAAVQYGAQSSATAADVAGMQLAASNEAANLTGVSTTVSISGICSSGAACTGTNNGSGPTCKNTDCQTSINDHIETVLTVTSSVSFSPGFNLPGLPGPFALRRTAVQKCLGC